jgi:hypothetical protein
VGGNIKNHYNQPQRRRKRKRRDTAAVKVRGQGLIAAPLQNYPLWAAAKEEDTAVRVRTNRPEAEKGTWWGSQTLQGI